MSTATQLIESAFERLEDMPGYVRRDNQRQLALLLSDLIGGRKTGVFEAPTGLGKSLASLIPAIAHGVADGSRVAISTYTNVLAEQYWSRDLPLALGLFEAADLESFKSQFLIGRQRYACQEALRKIDRSIADRFRSAAELGTETEFSRMLGKQRLLSQTWQQVSTPPVCPGRLCSHYGDCYYYKARRQAERANLVITNHSLLIQDSLLARASMDGKGLLGELDFIIVDEAHDLPQAAASGLEFELSERQIAMIAGVLAKLEEAMLPVAGPAGKAREWLKVNEDLRQHLDRAKVRLASFSLESGGSGIIAAEPPEVWNHPAVHARQLGSGVSAAREIADDIAAQIETYSHSAERLFDQWREWGAGKESLETARNYLTFLQGYSYSCKALFEPKGVSVSYLGTSDGAAQLRQDPVDISESLNDLLWERVPWACISATLALDGTFDHFKRVTGAAPEFEEALPTPFDFGSQAALYLPRLNTIPDPTVARREGNEDQYHRAVARELSQIILALNGRTLALFHSRKEMEAVHAHIELPSDLPILLQTRSGAGAVGRRFLDNVNASLFALRSFWTGFDAPGETLSCVALVRVPFEVPTEPASVARMAWLQTQGQDPFQAHTLPSAKMLMRQGAGRLIRRSEDRGVIALLDPRLRTKRYGEDIVANLPQELRVFEDISDAVAWIGIPAEEGRLAEV